MAHTVKSLGERYEKDGEFETDWEECWAVVIEEVAEENVCVVAAAAVAAVVFVDYD